MLLIRRTAVGQDTIAVIALLAMTAIGSGHTQRNFRMNNSISINSRPPEKLRVDISHCISGEPPSLVGATHLVKPNLVASGAEYGLCIIPTELAVPGERIECSFWTDCVVDPRSQTPIAVLAVRLESSSFYLLFNPGDPLTKPVLKRIADTGKLTFSFNSRVVSIQGHFFKKNWPTIRPLGGVRSDAWLQQATSLAPGIPAICAMAEPALREAGRHTVVFMFPLETVQSLGKERCNRS